jgi:hypothetical protein
MRILSWKGVVCVMVERGEELGIVLYFVISM